MIKLKDILQEFEIPSGEWINYDLQKVDKDGMDIYFVICF